MTETTREWYAVHVVFRYVPRSKSAECPIVICENIYVVLAQSKEEAREIGASVGRKEVVDDHTATLDGEPVEEVCLGVRKVWRCMNPTSNIVSGFEVSFLQYRLQSVNDLPRLMGGLAVDAMDFDGSFEDL